MKPRVLVVEDERAIQLALSGLLGRQGYDVDVAGNGDDAIAAVRANAFDLVLTDLVFPPTDGIQVLEEVKRVRPSTLVVVFSGGPTVQTVQAAFRKESIEIGRSWPIWPTVSRVTVGSSAEMKTFCTALDKIVA